MIDIMWLLYADFKKSFGFLAINQSFWEINFEYIWKKKIKKALICKS